MSPPRPQSVRVLAILNIAFAVLGLLGLLMTYAMYFGGMEIGPRNPVIELAREQPGYMSFLKWSFLIGGVRCLLLFVAGMGLLRWKPWARNITIGTALFGIISGVSTAIATYHYLIEPLSHKSDPGSMGGAAGGGFGLVLGL